MYYNNLLSIPILLVFSLLFEDWSSANVALNFPADNRTKVIGAMIISGLYSSRTHLPGACVLLVRLHTLWSAL
jgi:hypothetical protein